jgi:cell division protein ZapE
VPGDPIPHVAQVLAAKARLICFDELHVTDIADAMILGRLFKGLLEAQVVVVATSNVPPAELYKNGLNRALFLPFIELITQHMDVEEVLAAKDFRLEKLVGRPLYFTPADARAKTEMDPALDAADRQSPGRTDGLGGQGSQGSACRWHPWAWRASRSRSCASSRWGRMTSCYRPRLPHRA